MTTEQMLAALGVYFGINWTRNEGQYQDMALWTQQKLLSMKTKEEKKKKTLQETIDSIK